MIRRRNACIVGMQPVARNAGQVFIHFENTTWAKTEIETLFVTSDQVQFDTLFIINKVKQPEMWYAILTDREEATHRHGVDEALNGFI